MRYAKLQITTNFTFLHGASHPQEFVAQAVGLGLRAIGITDRNSLAGIVRAHLAAKELGLRLLIGCRLDFRDGSPSLLCYPEDRVAYGRLCRLLSVGKLRADKGDCLLDYADLLALAAGQIVVVVPPEQLDVAFAAHLARVRSDFAGHACQTASNNDPSSASNSDEVDDARSRIEMP